PARSIRIITRRASSRIPCSQPTATWALAAATCCRLCPEAASGFLTRNNSLRPISLEKPSPCKVNLLLNILGRRADGFHELETVMHPVGVFDRLTFARAGQGVHLTCSEPSLPTDSRNLVVRAAEAFLEGAGIKEGVRLHL